MWAQNKQKLGFTIVELLVVIVVIGILAAISIVAYNGIQARANDARTRTVAAQITKAIILWSTDSGLAPKGGWSSTVAYNGTNCVDGVGGWLTKGSYVCALEDILLPASLLPAGLILKAPKNTEYGSSGDGRYAFMFYPCSGTNRFALYWSLVSPSSGDTSSLTAVEASGCPVHPKDTYGMRAASIVQL